MKRLLVLVLCIGLLISLAAPANAIFGRSECEKVKSKVLTEEKIGKNYWESYRKEYSKFKVGSKFTDGMFIPAYKFLFSVVDSDLRVYAIVGAHNNCFTISQVQYARDTGPRSTKDKIELDVIIKYLQDNKTTQKVKTLTAKNLKALNDFYPNFSSIYAIKP